MVISGHKWSTTQSAQISQKQDGHNIYVIMKAMCPTSYCHNGFVTTDALGHMMYGYTFLVPMNQRVLNKQSKERNINGHKWSMTHRVFKHKWNGKTFEILLYFDILQIFYGQHIHIFIFIVKEYVMKSDMSTTCK